MNVRSCAWYPIFRVAISMIVTTSLSLLFFSSTLSAGEMQYGMISAQETQTAQPLILAAAKQTTTTTATVGSIHQPLDEVLRANVVDGQVDYPGIAADPRFNEYVERLKSEPAVNGGEEELAYWINAYNALAIKGILDGRSPGSFFGRIGYFKNAKYSVGGKEINLYDLERDVIIPIGEPRIHFAINCASASCPKLLSEAYSANQLEQQLETTTTQFINDPTRNRFDKEKKVAHISKIFDWFNEDFEKHSGSVQAYLAQYVDDPALAEELQNGRYKIKYLKYDWSLNGTPPKG